MSMREEVSRATYIVTCLSPWNVCIQLFLSVIAHTYARFRQTLIHRCAYCFFLARAYTVYYDNFIGGRMLCCFSSCYYYWLWIRFWEHTQAVHACFVMSKHYCGFDKSIDDITHTYVIWSVIAFFVPIQCLLRLLCFGSFVLASVVAVTVAVRWSDLTSTVALFNSLLDSVQTSLLIRWVDVQKVVQLLCF